MKHYHPLKVQNVVKETPDTVCVSFEVPDELSDLYKYAQGQHVGLRKDINGEDVRRSYSIASSVNDNQLDIAIRKVDGGLFSTFANDELKAGDVLEVFPPIGNFRTELDPKAARNYVAFAAGSGITPIISIIKTVLETEPKSTFTLYFGNRDSRSIIFKNRLSDLKNRYMDRFTVFHFLSRESNDIEIYNGRLNADKVRDVVSRMTPVDGIDDVFICGPGTMIEEVSAALSEMGLDQSRIHHEHFGVDKSVAAQAPAKPSKVQAGDVDLTVIRDGESFNMKIGKSEKPLLDTIADNGVDVPFSCKGGVCCTCRAKVVKGDVEMVLNYGLEDDDVKKGFILTCQSYPVSDDIVLDFDA